MDSALERKTVMKTWKMNLEPQILWMHFLRTITPALEQEVHQISVHETHTLTRTECVESEFRPFGISPQESEEGSNFQVP